MAFAQDLLVQARHLATLDKGRPQQANLRRAVSSAYYAVFHLLVANAVLRFIPKAPYGIRPRVGRAFQHGEMKQVCFAFQRSPLGGPLHSLLASNISSELYSLTTGFVDLQEARHSADYDTGAALSRAEALALIAKAESVFAVWKVLESTDEATVFLAALAFGARWSK